jgi:FkbM family methyltransferase
MLGNRKLSQVLNALTGPQHYVALFNMYRNYSDFSGNLKRYLLAKGGYPYKIPVKTPVGAVKPTLYCHDDLLTVNEIFCRNDYLADKDIKVVLDIGSNIGISALYFLARNQFSKCYLYEPDARNVAKLKQNLARLTDRYILDERAVSDENGVVKFGIEPTGRYGGIGIARATDSISVQCVHINAVLEEILAREKYINILKLDTEGVEIRTVKAIRNSLLERIGKIYLEAQPDEHLHPDFFSQRQYGSVCQLTNRHWPVGRSFQYAGRDRSTLP